MINTEENNIDILIGKVLSKNASSQEIDTIENWKKLSANNATKYKRTEQIWNADHDIFANINLAEDRELTKEKILISLNKPKNPVYQTLLKIAAILVIPLIIGTGWLLFDKLNAKPGIIQISTNNSRVSECILEDGTKVWLNSKSSLISTSNFSGKTREVNLVGEAFFDVAKNPDKPFIVHTKHIDIRVLGTSFNVKAIPEYNYIETTLEEGSVSLKSNTPGAQRYIISPGQQATFNIAENSMTINKVEAETVSAWRYGMYLFKDETLETIAKEIERIYDVKISFSDDELKQLRYRGMFEQDKTLFHALEKFKKTTNISYKINNKHILLYTNEK